MNLKGWSSHDSGVSIWADPKTEPDGVKNISLPTMPCRIGRERDNKPPVIETTFRRPDVRLPSAMRITAGTFSENRTRSGRRGGDCDVTRYGMSALPEYEPLFMEPADYRRQLSIWDWPKVSVLSRGMPAVMPGATDASAF